MTFFGQARRAVDAFGQEASKVIGGAAVHTGHWIAKHPGGTVGIVGSFVAAPIAIAVTPLVLGVAGFTSAGVAAGSAAAVAQAAIGNVAAGSAFAVLQSAGAGGAGLALVNGIVGASATATAVGATATGLAKAKKDDEKDAEEEEAVEKNGDHEE